MATMNTIKSVDKDMINNALNAIGCDADSIRSANMSFGKVIITLEFSEPPKVELHSTITARAGK